MPIVQVCKHQILLLHHSTCLSNKNYTFWEKELQLNQCLYNWVTKQYHLFICPFYTMLYIIYYICILSPTITVTTIERTNKLIYNKRGMRGRLLRNKSYNLLKQFWISRISHLTEDQLMALLRFLFHRMPICLPLFCTWTLNLIHGLIFTRLLWARLPLLSSVYLKPIRKGMDGSTSKWMI